MKTKLITITVASLLAGISTAQTAKVVPVDMPTAANLSILQKKVKDAQKAYDDAITEAERRLLTTRDSKHQTDHGVSCFAFREGDEKYEGTTGLGSYYTGSTTLHTFGNGSEHCETVEEKKTRLARESAAEADRAKWELEHPERYWMEGYCEGAIFTDDFRYLVPKPPSPATTNGPVFNWGSVVPSVGSFNNSNGLRISE